MNRRIKVEITKLIFKDNFWSWEIRNAPIEVDIIMQPSGEPFAVFIEGEIIENSEYARGQLQLLEEIIIRKGLPTEYKQHVSEPHTTWTFLYKGE